MKEHLLDFRDTGHFTDIILDYIDQKDSLRHFYKYPQSYDSFPLIIEEKRMQNTDRELLVDVLKEQYKKMPFHDVVDNNIQSLLKENTFTITTAHQNNIFTGPLYYHIKIICAINMCEKLNEQYSDFHFVPVFWMGTEDHDFKEINQIHLFGKTVEWHSQPEGPVGRMNSHKLKKAIDDLQDILGEGERANELISLFKEAYLNHDKIADATQFLLHEFYKEYGLVILDADDHRLKKSFEPIMEDEIFQRTSEGLVNARIEKLQENYKIQAISREINLFYMKDGFRDRIVYNPGNDDFEVLNTHLFFDEDAMRQEMATCPENFSPNVILRPLYQEFILPNLAYVGGGGEIAYWLELERVFEHYKVNFPMLVVRNSVLWIDSNTKRKMEAVDMDKSDIFMDQELLVKKYVKEQSEEELSLKDEKKAVHDIFQKISKRAKELEPTLGKTVAGEEQKTINAIEKLEAKLLKAEKRKFDTAINQIYAIHDRLFPNGNMQERYDNFIPFYLRHGRNFIDILKDKLLPLEKQFIIIEEE